MSSAVIVASPPRPRAFASLQPWPQSAASVIKSLNACSYLASLYLSKKVILQSQSKHRKIARACVDKVARGALARHDRLAQFNHLFPALVRNLIRHALTESQSQSALEGALASMAIEANAS